MVFVDGHTDFGNSAKTWLSKHVLHKIIYRRCAKLIEPYTSMFYGVLPARVEFFQNVYGIPPEKTSLLVLGADDSKMNTSDEKIVREEVRADLGVDPNQFVLISGGKIDRRKNIHRLMSAVAKINRPDFVLLLFGTPNEEMEDEFNELDTHDSIKHIGWISPDAVYKYFLASDLGVFPGTHSVLWEQAVGTGLPCLFKRWHGMQHVDVGGNCHFLKSGEEDEIIDAIIRISDDRELHSQMKEVSVNVGIPTYAYSEIAKRAIAI